MRYSILLDNYTIVSEEFLQEYKNASRSDKAKYQLDTFINKLNTKNYRGIYNKLDATFKNNNFKTLDSFEEFIKQNCYDLNNINVEEYDEQDGYSIFECELSNLSKKEENKLITVIINIQEETDFTMSFSFN